MNDALIIYMAAGLLLGVAGLAFAATVRFAPALVTAHPARWHRWGWLLIGLALALPGAWRLGASVRRGPAPIEVWSGVASWAGGPMLPRVTIQTAASAERAHRVPIERWAMGGMLAFVAVGILVSGLALLRGRRRLRAACAGLPEIKRVGRVRLCASSLSPAPFSARVDGRALIVVPTDLIADARRFRLVLSHEAHHHRRGDLVSAPWLELLQVLFFWNPAAGLWKRLLVELQDLDCDRYVLQRERVSAVEYGRCLIWAAESAHGRRFRLAGVRAMAAASTASLHRRMTAILAIRDGRVRRFSSWAAMLATVTLVLGVSWLAHGAVADRRVSMSEAAAMAARIEARSGLPVIVDEHVVEALNRMVANPEAREPLRKAFARMPQYRSMIQAILQEHGLPAELIAMPMHESRFDPEAHTNRPIERRAVGLWQILPGVARRLGLEVSSARDERLDPRRATESAAALLAQHHDVLKDWPLAIAAYNGGLPTVRSLSAGLSPADARARVLANTGAEYGRYLAWTMATMLLLDNPNLLD